MDARSVLSLSLDAGAASSRKVHHTHSAQFIKSEAKANQFSLERRRANDDKRAMENGNSFLKVSKSVMI